jgi:hypothetical protein
MPTSQPAPGPTAPPSIWFELRYPGAFGPAPSAAAPTIFCKHYRSLAAAQGALPTHGPAASLWMLSEPASQTPGIFTPLCEEELTSGGGFAFSPWA